MNIIELFDKAGIYQENQTQFEQNDFTKVQKQFELEKSQNPSIASDLGANLALAMKENTNELLFISSNRVLYNFFSRENYSRNRFSGQTVPNVSDEKIQMFINVFLSKDLELFFEEKIKENKFDDLDDFLAVKNYLPVSSLEKLNDLVSKKIDSVISNLSEKPPIDIVAVNFIKHRSFYDLLSHFRSQATDERVKMVLEKVKSSGDFNMVVELLNPMMLVMSNYKPIDPNLANYLKSNKEETIARTQKVSENDDSGLSGASIWGIIITVIAIIRLIAVFARN